MLLKRKSIHVGLDSNHNLATVKWSSAKGQLYRIKKSDFFNKVKTSERSWQLLKIQSQKKREEYKERIGMIKHIQEQILESNSKERLYKSI